MGVGKGMKPHKHKKLAADSSNKSLTAVLQVKEEAQYGEYRTKRGILEIYDNLQRAMATGEPYHIRLDPPPGDRRAAHPSQRGPLVRVDEAIY